MTQSEIQPSGKNDAAETAAAWVARLSSKDATVADRADFKAWLQADKEHATLYKEFEQLWGELGSMPAPNFIRREKQLRRWRNIANIAATCLILLLLSLLYQMGLIDRMRSDYYTSVGEVRKIALIDGSIIHLDTDSAIKLNFNETERRVELLRGNAFIDVAHDPTRPFIISDGITNAQALGTHFEMDTDSDGAEVSVEEGHVQVTRGENKTILHAGDQVRSGSDGRLILSKTNVWALGQWRTGKLVFSAQPLKSVLNTLGRYRRGLIIVSDNAVAEDTVSGVFDVRNTDEALNIIAATLPVTITHLSDFIVLVRAR